MHARLHRWRYRLVLECGLWRNYVFDFENKKWYFFQKKYFFKKTQTNFLFFQNLKMGIPGKTFVTSDQKRNRERRQSRERPETKLVMKFEEEMLKELNKVGCKAEKNSFFEVVTDYMYHNLHRNLEVHPGFYYESNFIENGIVGFVYSDKWKFFPHWNLFILIFKTSF